MLELLEFIILDTKLHSSILVIIQINAWGSSGKVLEEHHVNTSTWYTTNDATLKLQAFS